jgi:hypothetical protein
MTYTESYIVEKDGDPDRIKLLYISEESDIETCNSICFAKSNLKGGIAGDHSILVLPRLDEEGAFFAFGNEGRLKIARWILPEGYNIVKVDK